MRSEISELEKEDTNHLKLRQISRLEIRCAGTQCIVELHKPEFLQLSTLHIPAMDDIWAWVNTFRCEGLYNSFRKENLTDTATKIHSIISLPRLHHQKTTHQNIQLFIGPPHKNNKLHLLLSLFESSPISLQTRFAHTLNCSELPV